MDVVRSIDLPTLPLFRRGKVRDTYDLGDALLMVATDRISAFDVVLPTEIPHKGAVLTQLSSFWFEQTNGLVPNHLLTADVTAFPPELSPYTDLLRGRSMVVRKADRIDVECVVRGYLAGSAWAEYQQSRTIAGEPMPSGLRRGDRLPAPLFTPAIKHDNQHDVTIPSSELRQIVGAELAGDLEEASRDLFDAASEFALRRGMLIADTKIEFGSVGGKLLVIDELLTPDSSRFWDASAHAPGDEPASFDKQFVREWLERSGWNKEPPGPDLPSDVVVGTTARYMEAYERLTGSVLAGYQAEE
jgi:phosphoribosylaminoimidazole-succinocarboxamide synthase